MILASQDCVYGIIAVADTVKNDSAKAIKKLQTHSCIGISVAVWNVLLV